MGQENTASNPDLRSQILVTLDCLRSATEQMIDVVISSCGRDEMIRIVREIVNYSVTLYQLIPSDQETTNVD